jgi:hypothetical protein
MKYEFFHSDMSTTHPIGKVFYHAAYQKIILFWFMSEASFKRIKHRFIDCTYIGDF